MWYDRSTANKVFEINQPATEDNSAVDITFSNRIESYAIYGGCPVSGTGIPAGTTITSITNTGGQGFSMELSQQATSSGSRTLTFSPGWGQNSGLVRVYDSQGMAREIIFPSGSLGSDNNCWRAIKLDVQGATRSKRKIYQINQVVQDSVQDKASMNW